MDLLNLLRRFWSSSPWKAVIPLINTTTPPSPSTTSTLSHFRIPSGFTSTSYACATVAHTLGIPVSYLFIPPNGTPEEWVILAMLEVEA